MAIRNIRQEGDEILRKTSREVTEVNDSVRALLDDMVETMHAFNGCGLAGVQVGVLKRLLVIDVYDNKTPIIKLINPVIVSTKGEQKVEEGCLSFPNKFATVIRPLSVVVKGLDENGKEVTIKGKNLLAQALCHEIDHLNGQVFTDIMLPGTMEIVTPDSQQIKSDKKLKLKKKNK